MNRRRGFSLTLVIIALIMVSGSLLVLTTGSNAMLFHADSAYLHAVERNLVASGLAWAQTQASGGGEPPVGKSVDLDVASFGCPSARLVVQILNVQEGQATVRIETSCHKGRSALDGSRNYTVAIP